jgi:hypothetical protein
LICRLYKGFLEHQGSSDFDAHLMNVVGISPLDWNLKLQIACDLAHAMYQCHVRFAHHFSSGLFCFASTPYLSLDFNRNITGSISYSFRLLLLQCSFSDRAVGVDD